MSTQTRGTPAPATLEYYWDFVAETAMGRYVTAIETAFIERQLAGLPERPQLIVDAGAGSGRITRALCRHTGRVVATEVRPELVDRLARLSPNVCAVRVDAGDAALPVEDAGADGVVCVEVADLGQDPAFHAECHRVLRPGGLLIVTLQNRRSWKGLLARRRPERYRAEREARYYAWSLGDLKRSLGEAGLRVSDTLGFNWLPFTRASDARLVGPLSVLEGALQLRRLPGISPWVIVAAGRDG